MDGKSVNKFNIAIDIGTTSVEIAIIDSNGSIIDTCYFNNPQSLYGRDVITRINTAIRDKSFISIMKDLLIVSLKEHIYALLNKTKINPLSISGICICGNTTMISILMEYDFEELGSYPFNHMLDKSIYINSMKIFDPSFSINCPVILSGCTSAFIGGDVLSGLYFIEEEYDIKDNDTYIFLDLGTNGEMVLHNQGEYYSTSCACGPAFEASNRCMNIYGSTIIDAISMGIKSGKINKDGILNDNHIHSGLDMMGVHISADLLREILLAKAAIKTGIEILMYESNVDISHTNQVYIAGGFGFHLNIDNAIYIGLIPNIFKDKVTIVGNTSIKGAIKILSNCSMDNPIDNPIDYYIDKDIKLIQMANLPDYQERLLNNMNFR